MNQQGIDKTLIHLTFLYPRYLSLQDMKTLKNLMDGVNMDIDTGNWKILGRIAKI